LAIAKPKPRDAAVTSATRPLSENSSDIEPPEREGRFSRTSRIAKEPRGSDPNASPLRSRQTIESIRRCGITSLRGIAIALNNRGVRTARGGTWQVSNVRYLDGRQAGQRIF
jgi:hypothetical protein